MNLETLNTLSQIKPNSWQVPTKALDSSSTLSSKPAIAEQTNILPLSEQSTYFVSAALGEEKSKNGPGDVTKIPEPKETSNRSYTGYIRDYNLTLEKVQNAKVGKYTKDGEQYTVTDDGKTKTVICRRDGQGPLGFYQRTTLDSSGNITQETIHNDRMGRVGEISSETYTRPDNFNEGATLKVEEVTKRQKGNGFVSYSRVATVKWLKDGKVDGDLQSKQTDETDK